MTRINKNQERRGLSHHKRKRSLSVKTGPKKETEPFKAHVNALEGELATQYYIPKISLRS